MRLMQLSSMGRMGRIPRNYLLRCKRCSRRLPNPALYAESMAAVPRRSASDVFWHCMDIEISIHDLAGHFQATRSASPGAASPGSQNYYLLDVREEWEVEICALPGHLHIPMGELPGRAQQELDPEAHIIVVCHHGRRSLIVAHWLREQGFERVQSLAGGLEAWACQIDTTMPRY